jgi:hypothetical protein
VIDCKIVLFIVINQKLKQTLQERRKMKKIILTVMLVVIATSVQAGMSKNKIQKLVNGIHRAPSSSFLLKSHKCYRERGTRIVFVHEKTRYTVDADCWISGFQIWIRPDGTSHPRKLAEIITDTDYDGIVDSGSGATEGVFTDPTSSREGKQYQKHWQGVYNKALRAIEAVLP